MKEIAYEDVDVEIVTVNDVHSSIRDKPWKNSRDGHAENEHRYSLSYIQQGSYYHSTEKKQKLFFPVHTVILNKRDRRSYCNESADLPLRYICIHFTVREELPLEFPTKSRICLLPDVPQRIDEIFSAAHQLYRERPFGWRIRLRGIVEELLLLVFREESAAERNARVPPLIPRSIAVMRQRIFSELLSVGDVAQQCGVSDAHLIRVFSRYMGMTPKQNMDGLRVERACELLRYTDKSMEEIAEEAGFSEARQMRRIFRGIMGLSPREYRQRM